MRKILGALTAVISITWWVWALAKPSWSGLGLDFIKAFVFDRIFRMFDLDKLPLGDWSLRYGPPLVFAIIALRLLLRPSAYPQTVASAVNSAVAAPEGTIKPSTEMLFLRWRWLYELFAGPPFYFYKAKRRLEFIDSWARFFNDRKAAAPKPDASIRETVLFHAVNHALLEVPAALHHQAVTPDQLAQLILAKVPPELVKAWEAPTPSRPRASSTRQFTNRTIRELRALFEGRTILQGDQLIAPHKGLWIDTEGNIVLVIPGPTAVLQNGADMVECHFDPKWGRDLARYNNGDLLKVRGKISDSQNGNQIYLNECEIV